MECSELSKSIDYVRNMHATIRSMLKLTPKPAFCPGQSVEYQELWREWSGLLNIQNSIQDAVESDNLACADNDLFNKANKAIFSSTPVKINEVSSSSQNDSRTFFEPSIEYGQSLSAYFEELAKSDQPPDTAENTESLTKEKEVQPRKVLRETSYDRLPVKEDISPSKVRGKARKRLPGHACQDCEDYYAAAGIDAEGINKCTRHRGRQRARSPAGFWDVDMISTQEILKRVT